MTKETIIAVHQILREDMLAQLENARNIDGKISIVAGFNALLLVLSWQIYPHVQAVLFLVGIVLLVISLALLFKAYRTQNWFVAPSPQALVRELDEGKEIEEIYKQTIGDIAGLTEVQDAKANSKDLGIYRLNKKRIDQKAFLLNMSTRFLFWGLIAIGLSRIFFSVL